MVNFTIENGFVLAAIDETRLGGKCSSRQKWGRLECCHHSHPADFIQWPQYDERFLVGPIIWSCIMQPKRMDVAENEVAKSTRNLIYIYTIITTGKKNAFCKNGSH
jgi:hypothetical protein